MPFKATAISTWQGLLDSIEAYFAANLEVSPISGRVRQTARAPVFLQRRGHSMTIVGIERGRTGSRRLLVFDPAYQPMIPLMKRFLRPEKSLFFNRLILYQYRRDERYLKRYLSFEILYFVDPA